MKRFLYLFTFILIASSVSFAQKPNNAKLCKWMDDMRHLKVEYIAKELKLSSAQKEAFTPIYNDMNREISKLARETRELEKSVRAKGNNATDLEYEKATEAMFDIKGKEAEIEKKYMKRLKTILTKQQLFDLKRAERHFTRELMKHDRHKHKNKK